MRKDEEWEIVRFHCNNCGNICEGIKDNSGSVKVCCSKCKHLTIGKRISSGATKFIIYRNSKIE